MFKTFMFLKLNAKEKIILPSALPFIFNLILGSFVVFILLNPLLDDSYIISNFIMCIYIIFNLLVNTVTSFTTLEKHNILINSIPCTIIKKDIFSAIIKRCFLDLSLFILIFFIASIINKSLILPSAFTISLTLLSILFAIYWLEKKLLLKINNTKKKGGKYRFIKLFLTYFFLLNTTRILKKLNIYTIFTSNSSIFWILSFIICLIIMKLLNNNFKFYNKERR